MTINFSTRGVWLSAILLGLCQLGLFFFWRTVPNYRAVDIDISKLPYLIGEWKGADSKELDARSKIILNLDRYLKRQYVDKAGNEVHLYVGYWKKQTGETQAAKHSPILCLPANGWKISRPDSSNLSFSGSSNLELSTIEGSLDSHSSLFKFWFFHGLDSFSGQTEALLRTSVGMLSLGRTDGGIVEISTRIDPTLDDAAAKLKAEKVLGNFLNSFYPLFHQILEDTEIKK